MSLPQRRSLFPGEVLDQVTGYPCLYKYSRAAAPGGKPLIVFIPGGAHLARVAYGGHEGFRPEDFLAHWLNEEGFGLLAISYPLETQSRVMPATCPGFRINDWGLQAAAATKKITDTYRLSSEVLLVSWSMGGRVVIPFTKAAERLGLSVRLYVSLAATPGLAGLPGGNPGRANVHCSSAGYASTSKMLNVFLPQLRAQSDLSGSKAIIPDVVFARDYYGNTPISLLGWRLKHDGGGGFVDDDGLSVQDSEATEFARFPWVATLYPDSELDMRHALADKATWNFLFTLRLTAAVEAAKRRNPIVGETWCKTFAFVAATPDKLSTQMQGNHYFFVGEKGARATARAITQHWEACESLREEFAALLKLSPGDV